MEERKGHSQNVVKLCTNTLAVFCLKHIKVRGKTFFFSFPFIGTGESTVFAYNMKQSHILCTAPTLFRDWMENEENSSNERNYLNEFLIAIFFVKKSHILCIFPSLANARLCLFSYRITHFCNIITKYFSRALNAFVQNFCMEIAWITFKWFQIL